MLIFFFSFFCNFSFFIAVVAFALFVGVEYLSFIVKQQCFNWTLLGTNIDLKKKKKKI